MRATRHLNIFPAKGGISRRFSPFQIIHQRNLDYKKELCFETGTYVLAQQVNSPSNTNMARRIGCIYLRPVTENIQGGHELLDLQTGEVIKRPLGGVKQYVITDSVIKRVEELATRQGFQSLKFYNRKREEVAWDRTDGLLAADLAGVNINELNDDNYEIPESAPVEISDLQDEDDEIIDEGDKTIDEEELEILKLQDEDDEIPESALKQREDNDGEDNNSAGVELAEDKDENEEDDENTGVEPAEDEDEDENEEDDGNTGVEPPLRRSVRDRKEKEIFDPSSYLQTNTEEKKVKFEDQVKKQEIIEEHEYNLFTQSLDSNKKLEYSDTTMRIIAIVMVDIRN